MSCASQVRQSLNTHSVVWLPMSPETVHHHHHHSPKQPQGSPPRPPNCVASQRPRLTRSQGESSHLHASHESCCSIPAGTHALLHPASSPHLGCWPIEWEGKSSQETFVSTRPNFLSVEGLCQVYSLGLLTQVYTDKFSVCPCAHEYTNSSSFWHGQRPSSQPGYLGFPVSSSLSVCALKSIVQIDPFHEAVAGHK